LGTISLCAGLVVIMISITIFRLYSHMDRCKCKK
jgi:hypothetical protein